MAVGERRTCIRVVTRVENPKPWIIIVPKFEIPPLGMLPGGSVWRERCSDIGRQPTNTAQHKEEIKLVVHKRLKDLPWLQVFVLNTSLILPQSLDGNSALSLRKTRGVDRGVGQEYEHDDTPRRAKGAAT